MIRGAVRRLRDRLGGPQPRGARGTDDDGGLAADASAALAALPAGSDPALLLGYSPRFITNPYQRLLYRAAAAHRIAVIPAGPLLQVDRLAQGVPAGTPSVLHLHWLHPVLRDAESAARAERRLGRFLDRLDAHRAAGGRLAWTVHNVLPHETRFEALEVRLCAEVAARADVIHVMAANTAELVAPWYALPADRLLHVPHMSYVGEYPDTIDRADARRRLGIGPDALVFAAVGSIRPYKGFDTLLDAWAALDDGRPRRLLIAGAPTDDPAVAAVLRRARADETVIVDARPIPPDELQVPLRAADCAVLPHRRALNSGALALALTFGLPVLVSGGEGLDDVADPSFARSVPAGDPAAWAAALRSADDWLTDAARRAASERAMALAPDVIADRFASGLRARLAPSSDGVP